MRIVIAYIERINRDEESALQGNESKMSALELFHWKAEIEMAEVGEESAAAKQLMIHCGKSYDRFSAAVGKVEKAQRLDGFLHMCVPTRLHCFVPHNDLSHGTKF